MRVRFLNTNFNDGAYNMALDEAILHQVSDKNSEPTIRFYGWNPPSLSLGYFQSLPKSVNIDYCKNNNIGIVRRLTGGRAVLHDKELTYSVIFPEDFNDMPKSVTESYKIISNGLLEGFKELGLQADLSPEVTLNPSSFSSGACFDAPSSYELTIGGKKIVGSAQTRQRNVILQHGSILNQLDAEMLFSTLKFPSDAVMERSKRIFLEKASSIEIIKGSHATWDELCNAFKIGFERGLALDIYEGTISDEERLLAIDLKFKYESEEWNNKK